MKCARYEITARRADRLEALAKGIEEAGGAALQLAADVTQPAEIDRIVETTAREWGRLDILVNNSGIISDRTIKKMSLETFESVVRVNLTGTFTVTRAVSVAVPPGPVALAV